MSEQREARILIVDDQRETARVLRSSLELLNRGYFIVDVPSGEEAMLEMQRKEFDVLVTESRLPGMAGTTLIQRGQKRHAHLKAIIIAGMPIAEVKKELKSSGIETIFGIFDKPIDTAAFTKAVTRAIHDVGPKQVAAPVVESADPLGDIPAFDEATVQHQLSALMRDLASSAVVFIDRKGQLRLRQGALDQSLRFSELSVLLARNFTTNTEIAGYLGEMGTSAVHYYDGNWHDIYALSVGPHFFLAIVFPGGSQKQMGAVLRYGKVAAQQIVSAIGPAAMWVGAVEEVAPAPVEEVQAEPALAPADDVVYAAYDPSQAAEEAVEEPIADYDEAPLRIRDDASQAVEIDIDALDAELAEGADAETFWDESALDTSPPLADTFSADEAMQLGLLSKDEEAEQ